MSFALSLQVCSPANHSTSLQPSQHLTTGCGLTAAKITLLLADFVETISAAVCPMTELPLPALPCSHTAQCSVHHGLYCPAGYFHAVLLATAARAPLQQTSSKHFAFSEEQMPHQPFNYNKEMTRLFFPLRHSSSFCFAPALSPTPEPCLLLKFVTFLRTLIGYQ